MTVSAHLAAIAARDLDAYLATVHDDVSIILPNGKLITGRKAVADFHKDWFADTDWTMQTEVVHEAKAENTTVVVVDVDYHDLDMEGRPYSKQYLLSLVFVDGLLLHDQNTFW